MWKEIYQTYAGAFNAISSVSEKQRWRVTFQGIFSLSLHVYNLFVSTYLARKVHVILISFLKIGLQFLKLDKGGSCEAWDVCRPSFCDAHAEVLSHLQTLVDPVARGPAVYHFMRRNHALEHNH